MKWRKWLLLCIKKIEVKVANLFFQKLLHSVIYNLYRSYATRLQQWGIHYWPWHLKCVCVCVLCVHVCTCVYMWERETATWSAVRSIHLNKIKAMIGTASHLLLHFQLSPCFECCILSFGWFSSIGTKIQTPENHPKERTQQPSSCLCNM